MYPAANNLLLHVLQCAIFIVLESAFSLCTFNLCMETWSIVLLWVYVSVQYLDYSICQTRYCWCFVEAHCHDGVIHRSCTVMDKKATTILYMYYVHKVILRLPLMEDKKPLILHWWSFTVWGRASVAIVFASKGSQYLIYACLQQIAS